MVTVRIIGGLGNQMFQYAAGRALSLRSGVPLRLDITGFADYGLHQGFELQRIFNCPVEIATEEDVKDILGWQSLPSVRRVMSRPRMKIFRRTSFVVEPHFQYWSNIDNVLPTCYLAGYWQSEKYFSKVSSQIRKDFSFRLSMGNRNTELAKQIIQVEAVSLHVRRGDYANNPKTMETHGLCSLDYYRNAIQFISKKVRRPHFFVFSDDINWVKSNLKIDMPCQYVDHNQGLESYNDMRLMSLCQHHIIANSSFSWWGAWLNSNQNKIVIAPKKWFANDTNVKDLIPDNWIKI
jgi:hypothetical protein